MDQSTPSDHPQWPGHEQRDLGTVPLHQTLLNYGSDIMARITRSSRYKTTATPTLTPTKPATTDADTPIDSVETAIRNKDSKGPYTRQPRKRRQRDAKYKIKKRTKQVEGKKEALGTLNLPNVEKETLRAGVHGNKTAQKLVDAILEQRAELDRLAKQLNGDSKNSQDSTAASSNDSAPIGSRQRQRKTIV